MEIKKNIGQLVAYLRVSNKDQDTQMQKDAFEDFNQYQREHNFPEISQYYEDQSTGFKRDERQGLRDCLKYVRNGDTLYIWKLDRLSRNLRDTLNIIAELREKGVNLKSLTEKYVDISEENMTGEIIIFVLGFAAELEWKNNLDRRKAAMESATKHGIKYGRPKGLSPESQQKAKLVQQLYEANELSVRQIAKQLGISTETVYDYLKRSAVPLKLKRI